MTSRTELKRIADDAILLRAEDWCKDNLVRMNSGHLMNRALRGRLEMELSTIIDSHSYVWKQIVGFVRDYFDLPYSRGAVACCYLPLVAFADEPRKESKAGRNYQKGFIAMQKAHGRE